MKSHRSSVQLSHSSSLFVFMAALKRLLAFFMSKNRDNLDSDQKLDSEGTAVFWMPSRQSQIWLPEVQQHILPLWTAGKGWNAPARINGADFRAM